MGLLAVTAVYELYRAEGVCDGIETPQLFIIATTMNQISSRASDHDSEKNIVGGVLGFTYCCHSDSFGLVDNIPGSAGIFITTKMEKKCNTIQIN